MDHQPGVRRHPVARSHIPVAIPDEEWVEIRDAYGNLLARFHPPTSYLEFKARGERVAYANVDEYRLASLGAS